MTLERLVRSLVARALPARIAGDAADDLLDDHRRRRASHGAVAGGAFLIREAASLLAAHALASAARLARLTTLVRRDTVQAVRALVRRRWSTLGAVLMLAAGLAAVATASGIASALLFRPINEVEPDRIHRLGSADRTGRTRLNFSAVELDEVRAQLAGTRVAAANLQPAVLRIDDTDTQTLAEVVSGPYFEMAGLEVSIGRPLAGADAAPGADPTVVISDTLWRDRFGRDPAALGASLRLNGRAFTVIGIATGTSSSSFLGGSVDAWISTAHAGAMLSRTWRTDPAERWWTVLLEAERVSAEIDTALARAGATLAARLPDPWRDRRLLVLPGTVMAGSQRDAARTLSLVLWAFAGLILAAAAANVGGLFLAAAAAGRARAAIQLAIGSGRGALIRRQTLEGALVGAAGGVVALGLYAAVRREVAEVALLPTLSFTLDLPFDAQVAALTIGLGAAAGALLALGPALWSARLDVAQTLRDGAARGSGGPGLSRARRVLVAAQVAISITLLSGATLFWRSLDTLATLDAGFPRHGLVALDFDVEPAVASAAMLPGLAREALARVQAVPSVTAAAMSNRAPVDASTPGVAVAVPGARGRPLDDVTFYLATEGYFDTVGVPIRLGRAFTADEVMREADVAVVNETLAGRLWPDGDVLDRPLVLQPQNRTVRVVGVARDSRYRSLAEAQRPHLYLPTRPNFSRALLVRTADDPRRAILDVQAALAEVGPGVVGFFPRTFEDHVAIDLLPTRAAAGAAALLGALAFVLSAAGLYGMVMWFVEVRRRDIGVRLALGASARDVRRLVVGQAVRAALPGLVIGLALAVALTVFGQSLFVGVGAFDPLSLALGVGALALLVGAASYLPSRRATAVDPVIALRNATSY